MMEEHVIMHLFRAESKYEEMGKQNSFSAAYHVDFLSFILYSGNSSNFYPFILTSCTLNALAKKYLSVAIVT